MVIPAASVQRLLSCENYRSFISIYKEERSKSGKYSYSMIARRAGFSSRSFPRDVATGARKITLSSLYPMIKGLGLQGDLAEFFKTLVAIEHPETRTVQVDKIKLERKLTNLRDRLRVSRSIAASDPYRFEFFPIVYAACGEKNQGTSLREIQKKTSLPEDIIKTTLANLIEMKIVSYKGTKYFPTDSHFFFDGMKQSQAFKKFFQYLIRRAGDEASSDFANDKKLFFTSCLSVKESRLIELRNQLKQVLLEYVDAAESSDGEKIISVVCGLI
jgi:uncharacterized protein (TIGR02147 family)